MLIPGTSLVSGSGDDNGVSFCLFHSPVGGEGPVAGVGWGFGPMEATSEWNRLPV